MDEVYAETTEVSNEAAGVRHAIYADFSGRPVNVHDEARHRYVGPVTSPGPNEHYARALGYWGSVHVKGPTDVMVIGPIGSRSDVVLFWRSGKRVQTGCFEGSLGVFEVRIEEDYGSRLARIEEACRANPEDQSLVRERILTAKHHADYRALVALLRSIA